MFISKLNPIGIYEKALPTNISWRERLELAKKVGFDFVEISIDESDQRLERLNWDKKEKLSFVTDILETSIPVPSMCLSGHRRFPLGSLDLNIRKKAYEIMEKAIQFAADTGIRVIQLAGYDVYYEESSDKTKELFLEGISKSIDLASSYGVTLALEVMDTPYMGSVKKIMELVNKFNSPFFHVYPDLGNISAWGNDLAVDLESGIGHIVAVHVKETREGVFRRVSFGEGIVDFQKGFSQLSKMNYKGPFLIEMWTDDHPDIENILKDALKWVKTKMSLGGIKTER